MHRISWSLTGDSRSGGRQKAEIQVDRLGEVASRLAKRWDSLGRKVRRGWETYMTLSNTVQTFRQCSFRVTMLKYDPLRAAQIMMTGYGTHLRWQVATDQVCTSQLRTITWIALSKVKEGDLIRTHTAIPVNPIRPVEGDSHPLGALPQGTTVCLVSSIFLVNKNQRWIDVFFPFQVETWPGEGAMLASKAEENCKVTNCRRSSKYICRSSQV